MKLTVSNIAWSAALDQEAYSTLRRSGIQALEIAPTRLWPDWQGATPDAAQFLQQKFREDGFTVPSLQAILFAKPDCKLFGTEAERQNLLTHLLLCADLAAGLGATRLVFGAPKNRDRGELSMSAAFSQAAELFRKAAPYYTAREVCLCLEANPPQYGCNFITNSNEAAALVREVDSPGFRLHLDTACMFLAGEDIPAALESHRDILRHFHVSEPNLGSFDQPVIDHASVAAALASASYDGWLSLEMREGEQPVTALSEAVQFVQSTYGRGL